MVTEAGYPPKLKREWNRWRVVDMLLPDETDVDLCLMIEQEGHDLGRWMSKDCCLQFIYTQFMLLREIVLAG